MICALLQLAEKCVHVTLIGQSNHDLQFFHLDVLRVVVFTKENAHFVRKDVGSFLEEKVDVA